MDKTEKDILEKIFGEDVGSDSCNCPMAEGLLPKELSYAMAYIPFQQWETPYETDVALSRGTVFPCLDKPFIGEEAVKNAGSK